MPLDKFDVLAATLKSTFVNGFKGVVEPAPIEKAVETIPSDARVEHLPWLGPVPAYDEWQGFRRLAKIFNSLYRLENKVFDSGFTVLLDDLNDFQVDKAYGWNRKAKDLGEKAAIFPNRKVLQQLAKAAQQYPATGPVASPAVDTICWDGSQVFGIAPAQGAEPAPGQHIYGTCSAPVVGQDGGNVINYQAATGTGAYKIVAIVTTGYSNVKPLIWQRREGPELMTDLGTPQSHFKREAAWWGELRGAVGFAYWWDMILVNVQNLPTVQEAQQIFGLIKSRYRTFGLPVVALSDTVERVHEQTVFTNKNLLLVVSTALENIFDQVRTLSLIAQTENPFQNKFDLTATGFLD